MIMEKNNSSLRYVAGACFGIYAILIIIYLVQNAQNGYSFNAWALLTLVGAVLIAIAMFASIPMLIAVGGFVSAVYSARTLGGYVSAFYSARALISSLGYMDFFLNRYFINELILLVVWILIIVSGVNKKSGKTLAMIAGALSALRFFVIIFGNKLDYGSFGLNAIGFLSYLVIIVGTFMIGLASESLLSDEKAVVKASVNAGTNATSAESQVERLTKLKTLLDSGVISQEEFDEKKKQIIG